MKINNNQYNYQKSFGAKLKINSPEIKTLFAQELSIKDDPKTKDLSLKNLRENIEKFKILHPNQVIELSLRPTSYNEEALDVFNPQSMHIRSFAFKTGNNVIQNTFDKVFEFLVGKESNDFWTDELTKDLFVK